MRQTTIHSLTISIAIFAFLYAISSYTSFAQDYSAGILLGASVSQVDGDNQDGYHKIGLQGGGFINYHLNDKWALQGEILFVNKGSAKDSSLMADIHEEINAYYIDFALYGKYFFTKKLDMKFGLVPSVLIDDKVSENGIETTKQSTPFRKLGLLFSIGAEYYLTEHLFATIDFNYSIVSLRQGGAEMYDRDGYFRLFFENGQYYNYFRFSLGWQF